MDSNIRDGIVVVSFKESGQGSTGYLHIKIGKLDKENNVARSGSFEDDLAIKLSGFLQKKFAEYAQYIEPKSGGDIQIMATFNQDDHTLPQVSTLLLGDGGLLNKLPNIVTNFFAKLSSVSRKGITYNYQLDGNSYNYVKDNQLPRLEKNQLSMGSMASFFKEMGTSIRKFSEEAKTALENMIQIYQTIPDGLRKKVDLLKFGAYSDNNMALAIKQWTDNGRSGAPLFLLTENQWSDMYGRGLKQDALTIWLAIPFDKGAFDADKAEANTGFRQGEVTGQAGGRAFHKSGLVSVNQKTFYMKAYYDVTDTYVYNSWSSSFEDDLVVGNVDTNLMNAKLEQMLSGYNISNSAITSDEDAKNFIDSLEVNQRNIDAVTSAFNELSVQQPDIYGNIQGKSVYNMLKIYFMNQDFIDRNRIGNSKRPLDACIFATMMRLQLDNKGLVDMYLRDNTLANSDVFNAVKGEVRKFIEMVNSVNMKKSLSNSGVTDNQQSVDVKESFARMFNKLVEIKKRDAYGFVW